MGRRIEMVGRKFGHLLVLEDAGRGGTQNKLRWKCQCDCGNTHVVDGAHLRRGSISSCGCSKVGENNAAWTGCGDLTGSLWSMIKNGANHRHRNRKIEFDVTVEYAWELFLKQGRKCALSSIPLIMNKTYGAGHTASLDRIDSQKGYVEGNVQWVHKDINLMKNVLNQSHFIDLCRRVTNSVDLTK